MKCSNYGGGSCGSTPTTTVTTVSVKPAAHASGQLPFTGGDVITLGGVGIVLVLAGVAAKMTAGRLR